MSGSGLRDEDDIPDVEKKGFRKLVAANLRQFFKGYICAIDCRVFGYLLDSHDTYMG